MCRGFQPIERELLKIRAFYIRLSLAPPADGSSPDYLTLHYLDGGPSSPAFVTLHRVLSTRGVEYGSRERAVACEGTRFEIYVGDVKVVRGVFRRDDGEKWRADCKCDGVVEGMKDAEVSVAAEGSEVMTEKVDVAAAMRRRRRRPGCCEMEEIPEVREGEVAGSDLCGCSECCGVEEEEGDGDCEVEMEGVKWAVDVGIWAVCFGVAYLVCRASNTRGLMRKRLM